MPRASAIIIGLDRLEPAYYEAWQGESETSVRDTEAMATFLEARGFDVLRPLVNKRAMRDVILETMRRQAAALGAGDQLVVYFSGHGSQIERRDGVFNQAWCLHDGFLMDEEIGRVFETLPADRSVTIVSDCCNAGSLPLVDAWSAQLRDGPRLGDTGTLPRVKVTPLRIAARIYEFQKEFYDAALKPPADFSKTAGAVISFGASEDGAPAFEGPDLSLFTDALLRQLGSTDTMSYADLSRAIRQMLDESPLSRGRQRPSLNHKSEAGKQLLMRPAFRL
jgi:hypothetical protein